MKLITLGNVHRLIWVDVTEQLIQDIIDTKKKAKQ